MPGRSDGAQRGRRRAVRGVAAVAGAALAVAVVAGCASRGGLAARSDKSAGGAIQFAAAQIAAAKSVHVHGAISDGSSGDVSGTDAGTVFGTDSGTVDGSIVFAPTLQGDLTLKADHDPDVLPARILYDGTTLYTAIPKSVHATTKAKPNASWFAVNVADVVPKNSPALALLKSDPAALVKETLAKGKFTQTGTGTADGVAATHFTGDLTGDAGGHVEVWLDASGLPVEIVFQSTDAKQANQAKQAKQPTSRTELHFSQWGQPVTIKAPPADQVLTEQDQISFDVPGQQFKIGGDQLDGSTFAQNGGGVIIGDAPSNAPTQPICIPITLPSQALSGLSGLSGQPAQSTPTTICLTSNNTPPTHP